MSQTEEQVGRQAWPPQIHSCHPFLALKFTDSHPAKAPLGAHSLSFFRGTLESGEWRILMSGRHMGATNIFMFLVYVFPANQEGK